MNNLISMPLFVQDNVYDLHFMMEQGYQPLLIKTNPIDRRKNKSKNRYINQDIAVLFQANTGDVILLDDAFFAEIFEEIPECETVYSSPVPFLAME